MLTACNHCSCRILPYKVLCSRKNAFWRQREKIVRGGKKPVRGKKKSGRGRKKTSSRESPALQPKKLPQRKKYISATGKSSSPQSVAPIPCTNRSMSPYNFSDVVIASLLTVYRIHPNKKGQHRCCMWKNQILMVQKLGTPKPLQSDPLQTNS